VLEILTYLARNHHPVANLLLFLEAQSLSLFASHSPPSQNVPDVKKEKGKAKVTDRPVVSEESIVAKGKGETPLILLLKLLNQPLYTRSSAHLEQVIMRNELRSCVCVHEF
jgi:hypothetical protein